MSKTSYGSAATSERELTEDHRPLADSELDAVSGGSVPSGGHRPKNPDNVVENIGIAI